MCYPNDEFTELLEFCYIYPRIKIQGGKKTIKFILLLFKIAKITLICQMMNLYQVIYTIFISGICLFLDSISSIVKDYNCSSFTDGCPDAFYYSDRIFKRKYFNLIKSL